MHKGLLGFPGSGRQPRRRRGGRPGSPARPEARRPPPRLPGAEAIRIGPERWSGYFLLALPPPPPVVDQSDFCTSVKPALASNVNPSFFAV